MLTFLKIKLAKSLAAIIVSVLFLAGYHLTPAPKAPPVAVPVHSVVPSTAVSKKAVLSKAAPAKAPAAQPDKALGAFNPSAAGTYYLEGGINNTATTLYLTSFTEPISFIPYTMAYFNSAIEYATIDPNIPGRSELISFTGVAQNSDGSATLTGVVRGLERSFPYTASTTLTSTHAAQAKFILSDSPQLFNQYAVLQNSEVITGEWSGPDPLATQDLATKNYVDTHVNGGAVSNNRVVVAGTAGATVSAGNLLFYNKFTGQWQLSNSNSASTTINVILGIAQGSGTSGNPVTGGVLIHGLDSNQTSLSTGFEYYASSVSGSISATLTSRSVGYASSPTQIYFDPYAGGVSLFTAPVTFNTLATFASSTVFTGTTTMATTTINGWRASGSRTASTTTSVASLTLNNIPPTNHLKVDIVASTTSSNPTTFNITFNGDSTASYEFIFGNANPSPLPLTTSLQPGIMVNSPNQTDLYNLDIENELGGPKVITFQGVGYGGNVSATVASTSGAVYTGLSQITSITLTATGGSALMASGAFIKAYGDTTNP